MDHPLLRPAHPGRPLPAQRALPQGVASLSVSSPASIALTFAGLVQKGRRDQALRNLCWIRQLDASHPYLAEEFAEIEAAIEADQKAVGLGFWAPFRHIFRNPALLRRLLIATTLFMFQNGTGINAINYVRLPIRRHRSPSSTLPLSSARSVSRVIRRY